MLKGLILGALLLGNCQPLTTGNSYKRYDRELIIAYNNISEDEYNRHPQRWDNYVKDGKNYNVNQIKVTKEFMDKIKNEKNKDYYYEKTTKNTIEYCWLRDDICMYCVYDRE